MLYVKQLEYPHLKYNHNIAHGGPPEGRDSVKTSGCGLCCASMVVDQLTDKSLPIEECVQLAEENGASQEIGTSMNMLGKVLADRYALDFSYTNDMEAAVVHLQKGGRVIALVGVTPPFIYSSKEEIQLATEAKNPRYYLFSRKRP